MTIIASRLSDTGWCNRDTKIVRAPIVDGSQVRVERLLRRHRMSGFWKIDGPLRVDSAIERPLFVALPLVVVGVGRAALGAVNGLRRQLDQVSVIKLMWGCRDESGR